MTTCVALLRAVNLAGHNAIAMSALRDIVSGLGFFEVRTVLQSGNIIFRGATRSPKELESLLGREAKAKLGLDTDFFVRSARDWKILIERNPFREEASRDPAHLVVIFLKDTPSAQSLTELRASDSRS